MTETATNLPVVREPGPLDDLARVGMWLAFAESGADTVQAKGAAAALRLYYARELGLSSIAAADLSIIAGRLVVSAALLRALAKRAGYRVDRLGGDDTMCIARISDARTGELLGESTFTIDDAQRAGLVRDKSAWRTYPGRMLWARASKNAIVDFAPEVALGITLDDEVYETAASGARHLLPATYPPAAPDAGADGPPEPSAPPTPAELDAATEAELDRLATEHAEDDLDDDDDDPLADDGTDIEF